MRDVILHAFDWHYNDIATNAERIAAVGYGAVLIPPPLYSDPAGSEWWQRYQPKDYRVLRSYLGNKAELEGTIAALHRHGVRIYADIVFNHMANENRPDRLNFPGEAELQHYRLKREEFERDRLYGDLSAGLFSPWDFNTEGNICNWLDPHESTEHNLSGLPDLDLNDWVIEQQRSCLHALNTMGFDGYRIDAVKHLPEEHLQRVFETVDMAGKYLFGEVLTANDHEESLFIWPLFDREHLAFYDFPLHETLRRVFSPTGSMRELVDPGAFGQALPHWRAVTFSVTHDMPNNDGFRGVMLHPQDEYLANAYLLGRDGGVPLVYSDGNQSAARYPDDRNRWADSWQKNDISAMVFFHNAVHGLPQRPLFEDDGFLVLARGNRGIVAINKTDAWQQAEIRSWGLSQCDYYCHLHGHRMTVSGDSFTLDIPPREAQLWLC
ncbi:MAG: alpha-amylase family protein [Deltaproteobacteria bacterium]|nr:alpha-amylase family protein [Deltaproteobacteria bacterium]